MAPMREPGVWAPEPVDRAILRGLAAGETIDVVARTVLLSERTVRRRLRAMADEVGVDTTIELIVQAVRMGLI